MYIIYGILVGVVIILFLYPYYSNAGTPKSIDELAMKLENLTIEVKELRKTIDKRSEE